MDLVELFKSTDMPTMANFNEKLNKINNLFSETSDKIDGDIGALSNEINGEISRLSNLATGSLHYITGKYSGTTAVNLTTPVAKTINFNFNNKWVMLFVFYNQYVWLAVSGFPTAVYEGDQYPYPLNLSSGNNYATITTINGTPSSYSLDAKGYTYYYIALGF